MIKIKYFFLSFPLLILSSSAFSNPVDTNDNLNSSTNKTDQLDTIIVNASKFPEEQQNVAASASVITGKELQKSGVDSMMGVVQRVPNTYMIQTGNGISSGWLSIRGITPYMAGEPTVGYFVDGIYQSSINLKLLDISTVEVLRGPQSTLYGRNTEAGVINIQTEDPYPYTEGKVQLTYGNYNSTALNTMFGGGLDDDKNWTYRAALRLGYTDGYFVRPEDNNKRINKNRDVTGRIKLRWDDASSPWDISATLFSQHIRGNNSGIVDLEQVKNNPRRVHSNYEGNTDDNVDSMSINVVYETENYKLTSLSSYSNTHSIESNDVDFTAVDAFRLKLDTKYSRFSQEFRINSLAASDEFNWVAGVYLFDQGKRSSTDFIMPLMNWQDYSSAKLDTLNIAAFGQMNIPVTDKLAVSTGLRYDYERKKIADRPSSGNRIDDSLSFQELLPKLGVNYTISDNIMSYISISRGYKSGGFNTLAPAGYKKYDPEYTMNYELGLKSEWLDGRLRNNFALFWIDWKKQQVEQAIYPHSIIQNAGKSVSRGFEWEVSWKPINSLTLLTSLGYTDTHFKTYTDNVYDNLGNIVAVKDYKDKHVPNTPRFTYTLGVDYQFNENYYIRGDWLGTGKVYYDLDNKHKQSSYGILNLRGGYEDDRYSVAIWMNNVADKHYLTRAFDMQGTWVGRIGEPRTFGVTAEVKW